jgi:hypothetical protein
MCDLTSPDGLYGYVVRFPSDNLPLLWVAALAPVGLLLCLELGRFMQPATRTLSPPALRFPEASTDVQSLGWYLSQLALLLVASCVLVFVEAPTEPAWSAWLQQAQERVQPGCGAALQDIILWHNRLNVASILLGVIVPVVVVVLRELRAAYPPGS